MLGAIDLKDVVDVESSDVLSSDVTTWSIVTASRTYHFKCHSAEDCQVCAYHVFQRALTP